MAYTSIPEIHEALLTKKISVRDLVTETRAALQSHESYHAILGFYSDVLVENQIIFAENLLAEGKAGPLTGVPCVIKDNILVKGETATAASQMLEHYTATYNATVVTKLLEAGAIPLARANMDEFAMGSSTENSAFGPSHNPVVFEAVPGGSSGGSAVTVALNDVVFSLGSDTGGSIRQPAAFCGVVGLKPTYGHVSRSGLIAMASSLDQIGPFTHTVSDAETVYKVIAGKDPLDATSLESSECVPPTRKPQVVGVPRSFIAQEGMDARIMAEFEQSLQDLVSAGYALKDVELPSFDKALAMYYIVCPAEVSSNMGRYDGVRYGFSKAGATPKESFELSRTASLGKEVQRRILLGTYVLSSGYYDAYYRKAELARANLRADLARVFEEVDALVIPNSPVLPWKIGEKMDPLSVYLADVFTVPVNMAGVPALTVPTKRTIESFPGSIQLIAPHHGEDVLFTIGKAFENMQK